MGKEILIEWNQDAPMMLVDQKLLSLQFRDGSKELIDVEWLEPHPSLQLTEEARNLLRHQCHHD